MEGAVGALVGHVLEVCRLRVVVLRVIAVLVRLDLRRQRVLRPHAIEQRLVLRLGLRVEGRLVRTLVERGGWSWCWSSRNGCRERREDAI